MMDRTLFTTKNSYYLQQQIGQGGQGAVFPATTCQPESVAIEIQRFSITLVSVRTKTVWL